MAHIARKDGGDGFMERAGRNIAALAWYKKEAFIGADRAANQPRAYAFWDSMEGIAVWRCSRQHK